MKDKKRTTPPNYHFKPKLLIEFEPIEKGLKPCKYFTIIESENPNFDRLVQRIMLELEGWTHHDWGWSRER